MQRASLDHAQTSCPFVVHERVERKMEEAGIQGLGPRVVWQGRSGQETQDGHIVGDL